MRFLLLALVALPFHFVSAQDSLIVSEIQCVGSDTYFDTEIELNVNLFSVAFDKKMLTATATSASLGVVINSPLRYEVMPRRTVGAYYKEALQSVKYRGTKYKGYIKIPLVTRDTKGTGASVESANLIINPNYDVIKTIPESNHFNKDWTWDREVRKYKAVLDYSFNDHHGDYGKMDCYSTGIINEVRP